MNDGFPAGSCDTHIHIYDDRYPTASTTVLRPPNASVDEYRLVQTELRLQRVVLVQPSTYGFDNSCQLAAATELGDEARLVVVVGDGVTNAELDRLTGLGARGARFHMLPGGAVPWSMLTPVADRIASFGWHVQLQLNGRDLGDHSDDLFALPTDLVIDHVGRFMPPVDPDSAQFDVLLRLVDTGRCWVKLSAPYESAQDTSHAYLHVSRCVRRLIDHAPERMLWASNWPHPGQPDPPSATDLLRLAMEWMPNNAVRHQILVDNPATLYGF